MPNIINNTNLDKIQDTIEKGQKDRQFLRKPVKLQGEWLFDLKNGYQFKTELTYEKGKQTIEIDSPSFLGGNGNRVGILYCRNYFMFYCYICKRCIKSRSHI
jgi:hypothetical protein